MTRRPERAERIVCPDRNFGIGQIHKDMIKSSVGHR